MLGPIRAVFGVSVLAIGMLLSALSPAVRAAEAEGEKIYQRALWSTVWVVVPVSENRAMTGTGSLVHMQQRLILTNYHVVGDRDNARVFFPIFVKEKGKNKLVVERDVYKSSSGSIAGKVVSRDKKKDLALIQLEAVPEGAKPLMLAADGAGPGQRLHSIGNPGASDALWVYTSGTCRQVYHKKFLTGKRGGDLFEVDARIVETQSPVNSGDSGGPVLNDRGELVAVTQSHLNDAEARLVSIFIDISEVKELLKSKGVKNLPVAPVASKPRPVAEGASDSTKTVAPANPEDPKEKAEKDAARKLKLAKSLLDAGKSTTARNYLKDIVANKAWAETDAAKEARTLLDKLDKSDK